MSEMFIHSHGFYKNNPAFPILASVVFLLLLLPRSTGTGFIKLAPAAAALITLSGDSPLTKYRGNISRGLECLKCGDHQTSPTCDLLHSLLYPHYHTALVQHVPAKLRIFQNVDLCVLTIHNLFIPDIYLYRDYSDSSSSYSLKAVPTPITSHQTHGLCHRCAQWSKIRNVSGSSLLFKLLSLGSFQNSKWTIKNYNFLFFPPLNQKLSV